ncbi:hypothetical protein PHLCEN_2v6765 [Hermanssonia centrifuga]|uniref:Uncharacterized protein n=1 Tax=Hermanssonia centrifuga TaxID=98765 RepID=A0A2R6NYJ3_9APHY|nr:hypothetical protein PHLCEN_2v6765 [Hermanssonia centrifuga]
MSENKSSSSDVQVSAKIIKRLSNCIGPEDWKIEFGTGKAPSSFRRPLRGGQFKCEISRLQALKKA